MLAWLAPVLGLLLLALLAVDVFQTAFHAEGRGGPVNRRQNRAIWRTFRWIATRGGRTRAAILSLAGPAMAVTTIAGWSLLLLTGFWLIYLPVILSFSYPAGEPGSALMESFYYSGIVAATLGHGDVVARGSLFRFLTVVEAFAGFALLTVAVTYVLAVYRELVRAQTLAASIDARLRVDPDSGEVVDLRARDADAWDRTIALRLAQVLESHYNYPILHYFRPSRSRRAVPWQVARLYQAKRDQDPPEPQGDSAGDRGGSASHMALMSIIGRYVAEVHALFVPLEIDEESDQKATRSRLDQIVHMLRYDSPVNHGRERMSRDRQKGPKDNGGGGSQEAPTAEEKATSQGAFAQGRDPGGPD